MNEEMKDNGSAVKTKEEKQVEIVLQPFYHIAKAPMRDYSGKLIQAFNYWLKLPKDKLQAVGEILNLLDNSIWLVDDIIDDSSLRRGVPVAHSIYGLASTINASNYVLFLALERIRSLNHPDAVEVFSQQMKQVYRGQGIEIYWRDNSECPSEEEWNEMVICKTGGIVMLAMRLMQLFSDNKEDFTKFVNIVSIYCNIQNDYCSLWDKETFETKGYCEDLTEGKFSFPIIHAIKSRPDDRRVINILRKRTRDNDIKRYCVTLLENGGSKSYTREKLIQLEQEVRAEMSKHGENPFMNAVMDVVASFYKGSPSSTGIGRSIYSHHNFQSPVNKNYKL